MILLSYHVPPIILASILSLRIRPVFGEDLCVGVVFEFVVFCFVWHDVIVVKVGKSFLSKNKCLLDNYT